MADQKYDFPKMPATQWWALRNRFKQSIPGTVTISYLATALDVAEDSARINILPALKRVGLIDEEGKPQERAREWRDDQEYPKVCEEIKREVYPEELLHAVPDPTNNRASAERWFANKTGAGTSFVQKVAAFYQLLSEADPSKGTTKSSNNDKLSAKKNGSTSKPRQSSVGKAERSSPSLPEDAQSSSLVAQEVKRNNHGMDGGPALHIDVQIHISPDASSDQIDQIFASMAKHLYKRNVTHE